MKDITVSATEARAAAKRHDFPHLSKAPIGEAVIEFRGRTEVPWNEDNLLPQLREALPDYPLVRSEREIQQDLLVQPNAAPQNTLRDLGCKGFDFRSHDELQIAKFHRDLFSFSRLRPYQDWQQFTAEALRLWRLHNKIAAQMDIQRLGVRFINQFELSDRTLRWDQYLKVPPASPKGLDLKIAGFFHRDVFAVPESALLSVLCELSSRAPNRS